MYFLLILYQILSNILFIYIWCMNILDTERKYLHIYTRTKAYSKYVYIARSRCVYASRRAHYILRSGHWTDRTRLPTIVCRVRAFSTARAWYAKHVQYILL